MIRWRLYLFFFLDFSINNDFLILKVFEFSADGDHDDSNVEYNRATLDAGDLLVPTADGTSISFTICSALMVEAFTTGDSVADMFSLHSRSDKWGYISLWAASNFTEYEVRVGSALYQNRARALFFPLQWTRACLSLDWTLNSNRLKMVVDGQLLVDEQYARDEGDKKPSSLSLCPSFFIILKYKKRKDKKKLPVEETINA